MSLKSRLIFSFSLMILLSIFLGAIMIASSSLLKSRYIAYSRDREVYDLLQDFQDSFEHGRRALDGYMVGVSSEKEKVAKSRSDIAQILGKWKSTAILTDEKEEQKQMEARLNAFWSGLDQVFRLVEADHRSEAVGVMDSFVLTNSSNISKDLKALAAQKKMQSERSWESARHLGGRITLFSSLLLLAVFLAGAGSSILVYQSISNPLAKLREGTRKIAGGDWNLKLDISEPVELSELARSFEAMAKALKDLEVQVVQMDRMSAVGTLAGGVAHEINNPLSGVLGQAQILLEKLAPGDPNRANIEKIERAAQRCRTIVRGLLDFSRPGKFTFVAVDVHSVIESTLSLCESELSSLGIKIDWNKSRRLPLIYASSHHLQQVFLNIITNSIHAMPQGGTLAIRMREAGDYLETSFKDTGIGIDPDHLTHLFDPFFTTKEPGKGTGLGLTISYGIVQQHRGHIWAESNGSGKGATFTVSIPVAVGSKPGEAMDAGSILEEVEKRVARFPMNNPKVGD